MKNLTMAAFAATMVVTSAFAEEATVAPVTGPVLGGSIELKFKEDAAGDWGATNTIGASITMPGTAFASFNVESVDGATAQLDEWQLGTEVNDGTVSIGKQGDIWVAAEGEHTIHNPKMDESIQLNMGKAAVAVEFGDFTNDVSDIEAVAGALTFGAGSATVKGAEPKGEGAAHSSPQQGKDQPKDQVYPQEDQGCDDPRGNAESCGGPFVL